MTLAAAPLRSRTTTEIGLIAGSVAVFTWGMGPLFIKGAHLSTPTIVGIRFLIAAPVLHAIARWRGARVDAAVYRRALVPGLLFGATILLGFAATKTTSVTNASLIGNMMPIAVLLYAWLALRQTLHGRQVAAAAAAAAGLIVVVLGGSSSSDASFLGDLLAFGNLVLWTAYFLRTKRMRDAGESAWAMLAAISTICAVVISPACLLVTDDLGAVDVRGLTFVVAIVLLPGVIGHGLMTWSSKHLDVTVSSVLTLGSPVVSAVGAWIWLGESINAVQGVGAVVVLCALAVITLDTRVQAVRDAALSDPPE